jgi:Golgi phosphoprotein 3 GPP34
MTTLTLSEEVMLLSLDDDSGTAKERGNVGWAAGGGVLVELTLAGRIDIGDDRVTVRDDTPTGVPYLDEHLARIAGHGRPWKVGDCLRAVAKDAAGGATQALVDRGVLREEKKRVLGLFPTSRYPEVDGAGEEEVRCRLDRVVTHGADPDERTAALVALLHGARLRGLAFPQREGRKQIEARMAQIAEGQWVQPAVRRAIDQAQAAMTAIIVSTATTTAIAAS